VRVRVGGIGRIWLKISIFDPKFFVAVPIELKERPYRAGDRKNVEIAMSPGVALPRRRPVRCFCDGSERRRVRE